MSDRMEGQHVMVTGGAKGIGAAIVRKVLREGGLASVMDIDAAALGAMAHETGQAGRLGLFKVDITDLDALKEAHAQAVARSGEITALVNNAGRNSYADPVTMTEEQWEAVFAIDLKAAWYCAKLVLPAMIAQRRGAILNIASVHADQTFKGYFPYAAAKSGLVGLTRSLALEVAEHQVRVNALSPGWTATELVRDYLSNAPAGTLDKVLEVHPMGRIGTPDEVANCAVFLLSDEASFVTGAHWRVDGGIGARFAG